jgi:aminoglycoside phosphotransferase (APT) family kinase protein
MSPVGPPPNPAVATRLPPEISVWLGDVLDRDPPTTATPMRGANRASAFLLEAPADRPLVLRWFGTWPGFDEGETAELLVRREALAVSVVAGGDVRAPRLISRHEGDHPALLLEWLPGEIRMEPPDVRAVRALLDRLHDVHPGDLAAWTYHGYHEGERLLEPAWWRDASVWERARVATETARPGGKPVLIHRDFHAGNLLWADGRLTGVIDWGQACVGPAEFDTAHWRVNHALLHGVDALPPEMTGDPAWDIEAAFGTFDRWDQSSVDRWRGPWSHIDAATAHQRLETFMARAVAELG